MLCRVGSGQRPCPYGGATIAGPSVSTLTVSICWPMITANCPTAQSSEIVLITTLVEHRRPTGVQQQLEIGADGDTASAPPLHRSGGLTDKETERKSATQSIAP